MPRIRNEQTGEIVVPNVLLSTKNIPGGLGGVNMEMSAITNLFGSVSSFETWSGPKPTRTFAFEEEMEVEPKLPSGVVMMIGQDLEFTDSGIGKRTVKCSYGIMRVLQLRHISALKQHYSSTIYKSFRTLPKPLGIMVRSKSRSPSKQPEIGLRHAEQQRCRYQHNVQPSAMDGKVRSARLVDIGGDAGSFT